MSGWVTRRKYELRSSWFWTEILRPTTRCFGMLDFRRRLTRATFGSIGLHEVWFNEIATRSEWEALYKHIRVAKREKISGKPGFHNFGAEIECFFAQIQTRSGRKWWTPSVIVRETTWVNRLRKPTEKEKSRREPVIEILWYEAWMFHCGVRTFPQHFAGISGYKNFSSIYRSSRDSEKTQS